MKSNRKLKGVKVGRFCKRKFINNLPFIKNNH